MEFLQQEKMDAYVKAFPRWLLLFVLINRI
ncbi:hypothetical protein OS145_01297 [Idiomarina baltica OS145]|uniref:Uncharacterized protein n=1 Tax=Idiomarina baltica OS145 TaxID=314276 RepID=A0ABP2CU84_9GAMM|nr:hypothetical protein OS145_01297 [Idiomarina baltica OS145]